MIWPTPENILDAIHDSFNGDDADWLSTAICHTADCDQWGALVEAMHALRIGHDDMMYANWPLTLRLLEYIRPHRRHIWQSYDALYTHVMSLAQTPEQAAEVREHVP